MSEYVDKLLQQHKQLLENAAVSLRKYTKYSFYKCDAKSAIIRNVCEDEYYATEMACRLNKCYQLFAYHPIIDIVVLESLIDSLSIEESKRLHEEILTTLNNRRNNK